MERPCPSSYSAAVPPRAACVYSSCYCEENVWKLCEYIRSQDRYPLEEFYAVFICSDRRMIPLWKQKSGHGDEPVVWVEMNPRRRNSPDGRGGGGRAGNSQRRPGPRLAAARGAHSHPPGASLPRGGRAGRTGSGGRASASLAGSGGGAARRPARRRRTPGGGRSGPAAGPAKLAPACQLLPPAAFRTCPALSDGGAARSRAAVPRAGEETTRTAPCSG